MNLNKSADESRVSGVSPFLSAEDLHYSISRSRKEFSVNKLITYDSLSSFYTCNSSVPSSTESNNNTSNYTTATSSDIESRVSF